MNAGAKSEPGIGALLGSLASDTGTLVRQEIHLATTEMSQKAKTAGVQIGVVGMGGALAHAGLLALIAAIILGLGTLIPMWISALAIGLLAAGSGWALVHKGVTALRALDALPVRTIETLQQDKTWIKEQVR
jgi:hypothetical protein